MSIEGPFICNPDESLGMAEEEEENVGIEGIENMSDNQQDVTELPDGEVERQRQDEERQRRLSEGNDENESET